MTNHKEYLGLILENLIPLTKEEIEKDGVFLNVELPSKNLKLKTGRMDLLLQVGKYSINLEANSKIDTALIIRNEAHFSWMIYQEYARKDKKTLEEILYQIAFNKKYRLSKELIVRLQYFDKDLQVGDENFLKIEINLENVKDKYYNKEKLNRFEKALLLLVIDEEEEIRKIGKGDRVLEEVGEEVISYSRAKEIVDRYEMEMIEENFRRNRAEEEGFNKGLEKGLEKGIKKGIKKGIEKGIEKGRQEATKESKIEMAKSMLKDDMPVQSISKYSGLSIDEIEKLKLDNQNH